MRSRLLSAFVLAAVFLSSCSLTGGSPDDANVIAYFTDVGDLVEGGQVQLSDVEVGRILDIELVNTDGVLSAKVAMSVDAGDVPVTDIEAVIRQTSLLGEQFVELVPVGSGEPYLTSEQITIPVERTERRTDIETFLGDLSAFVGQGGLEDLNRFTHSQALILEERGRRFGAALTELERFTSVLADRRFDVGAAVDSLASASTTLADNKGTLDSFLDSLEEANALLADQGDELGRLFASLRRFGTVNARFLARHEGAINRQFRALRPIFDGLADAEGALRADIRQLRVFLELFPKSMGGGPGGSGRGDYIQADAVLCESLALCSSKGERGDVPGEGRDD
ncbi:MAG TPA: MCE family protein [Actinomycetota bacterium]|nr:MCE family protein [Actinomycetota bacterium]